MRTFEVPLGIFRILDINGVWIFHISLIVETGTLGYKIFRQKINGIWDSLTPHNGAS